MNKLDIEEVRDHVAAHRHQLKDEVSYSHTLQTKFLARVGIGLTWCGDILVRWGATLQTADMQIVKFPTERRLLIK